MESLTKAQGRGKVLFLTIDFPPVPGGISVYLYNLIRHLPHEKILVLAPRHTEKQSSEDDKFLPILRTRKARRSGIIGKGLLFLDLLQKTLDVTKTEKIEAIWCLHLTSTGLIGLLLRLRRAVPFGVFIFGAEFGKRRALNWLQKIILRKAQKVIVISDFAGKVAVRHGVKMDRITKVTPGVDPSRFRGDINDKKIRHRHNLNGKKIILTISRLAPNKGVDTSIRVVSKMSEIIPDVTYLIGGEGPCQENLNELVGQLNMQDRVIFAGYISDEDLPTYYNTCDVFLLLTREIKEKGSVEGFGMVFLEANACGKPVVGGRAGGTVEAIIDGETGFLVDPTNEGEILEKLIALLTDENLRQKLGAQGRARVEQVFPWEKKAAELWKAVQC
jgi:phosphatidylinositol alpha-1,6-mannosyltransferase